MSPGLWAQVSALFDDLRDRPAPEREARLLAHSDDTTRAAVTGMLQAYDRDPAFDPAAAVGDTLGDVLAPALIGRRLGAYRLVAEIGRGGMGIVYEAQRDDDEFDRRAAIKILPAWSAAPVVERFRFERRVLAGLDHPGIAKLLDAGSTSDGMPYLVMELVDGQPIDAWCDAHKTSVRARVALVEKVCTALAYAHQRLVVHRDVKAANILVTAAGEPKLLDFGISTLLATDGSATTGLTQTGHHSYTPEFASPEQIRGERVTTASDVYSLGVVLYRLLAGSAALRAARPVDARGDPGRLRGRAAADAHRRAARAADRAARRSRPDRRQGAAQGAAGALRHGRGAGRRSAGVAGGPPGHRRAAVDRVSRAPVRAPQPRQGRGRRRARCSRSSPASPPPPGRRASPPWSATRRSSGSARCARCRGR